MWKMEGLQKSRNNRSHGRKEKALIKFVLYAAELCHRVLYCRSSVGSICIKILPVQGIKLCYADRYPRMRRSRCSFIDGVSDELRWRVSSGIRS